MSSMDNCIKATAAELGLEEKDVREIAGRLSKEKARLEAGPNADRADEQLRQFAKSEADTARIAAALKQKQAALNIIARDAWDRRVNNLVGKGYSRADAIISMMVGDYRLNRQSVSARRMSIENGWMGGLFNEMRADPDLEPMIRMLSRPSDIKPFADNVTREMFEVKDGGKPGVTGDARAQKMAKLLAKYQEARRTELNRAGANTGKLDGRAPQSHDAAKLLRVTADEWARYTADRLDLARSLPNLDPDKALEALRQVYLNITTGEDRETSAALRGERAGPANLARSLEKHRVLHFKDADSWLEYADKFGRGNVVTASLDEMRSMARKASLMQIMGPNPGTFLQSAIADQRQQVRQLASDGKLSAKEAAKAEAQLATGAGALGIDSKIGRAFREVSGETMAPLPSGVTVAKISSGIRAVQSMAKLGGAVISSVTDLATLAHRLRFQGKGILESYGGAFDALLGGRSPSERREIANLLLVGHETMLGDIHSRFAAEDALPGWASRGMQAFFKLSGLTGWTDRLTNAFAAMTSSDMAAKASQSFGALDQNYRHMLGIHGIDEARWDVVRQAQHTAESGSQYIIPEKLRELPDEAFTGLTKEGTPRQIERARQDLEHDLSALFHDEASFAILRPDDRTRMTLTMGTRPGTTLGEAIRFFTQFKSFPVAYLQKVLTPGVTGAGRGGQRDIGGVGTLIAMSTLLGYGAMSLKDLLKNKTPHDPTKAATIVAAMQQGGGLGIYGDYLFGQYSRTGSSPIETLAGPTAGLAGDVAKMWMAARSGDAKASDALRLALGESPFLNVWWLRPALDLAVLNDLQEWASPGTFRRRESDMKKNFGQAYLVNPLHPARDIQMATR